MRFIVESTNTVGHTCLVTTRCGNTLRVERENVGDLFPAVRALAADTVLLVQGGTIIRVSSGQYQFNVGALFISSVPALA